MNERPTGVFVQPGLEQGTSAVKHCSANLLVDAVLTIIADGKAIYNSKEIHAELDVILLSRLTQYPTVTCNTSRHPKILLCRQKFMIWNVNVYTADKYNRFRCFAFGKVTWG